MHEAGFTLGATIAVYGAGFSIGRHLIKTMRGKIRGSVAIAHVIRDTAICFGVSYVGGALASGAMSATGQRVPTDFGAGNIAAGTAGEVVVDSASALTGAANNLIDKVTHGAFDAAGSAGSSVGSKLTALAAGTPLDGVVGTIVGTLSATGSLVGGGAASIIPAALVGAVIGGIYSLIFDR